MPHHFSTGADQDGWRVKSTWSKELDSTKNISSALHSYHHHRDHSRCCFWSRPLLVAAVHRFYKTERGGLLHEGGRSENCLVADRPHLRLHFVDLLPCANDPIYYCPEGKASKGHSVQIVIFQSRIGS